MTPDETSKPQDDSPSVPVVSARSKGRISWIWLVPLVAALAGVSLLVRDWMRTGPTIEIQFEAADGLEAGQTKLRYRDVVIGVVTDIRVAPDRKAVMVKAQLDRDGSEFVTRKETRFWVVRPRLGVSGVSGLGTLLSGAYIGVDAPLKPSETHERTLDFIGLENPPEVTSMRPGSRFTLHASELSSLEIGSPVYYRRIPVGRVIGYALDSTGSAVNVQIFVDEPYNQFVTRDARFWNVSGIQASFGAEGFNLQMASLASIVAGGIGFSPAGDWDAQRAPEGTAFVLAGNQQVAMAEHDGPPVQLTFHFHQSVRGLSVGALVDFTGLELGRVNDIDMMFDPEHNRFYALVKAEIYPLRMGNLYEDLARQNPDIETVGQWLFAPMIKNGLRAQMRAANLLTGQQYVALDFFPDDKLADPFQPDAHPLRLPTVAGDFDRLQQQISSIVSKLDAVPFQGIGEDLRSSLQSVSSLMNKLGKEVTPQASAALKSARQSLDALGAMAAPDSPMRDSVGGTLRQVESAARALRALADYLQSHPDALLRGRGRDVLPPGP